MTSRRRGFTLIEVLVMITLIGVALTAAVTTLVALLRIERQVRSDQTQHQSLISLASRWRADAHAAVAASTSDDCEMTLSDGRTIRYSFEAPRIVREVRRAGDVVHRDAFVISPRAEVAFAVLGDPPRRLVQLSISPKPESDAAYAAAVRPALLDAAVNLHGAALFKGETP
jgi:prepilin-type N-terminal cleavage/methylation domain-containing protein